MRRETQLDAAQVCCRQRARAGSARLLPYLLQGERGTMKVSSFEATPPFTLPVDDRQVLVVEGDPDQRRRVVSQLQHWGYLPVIAGSGEEALALEGHPRFAFALIAIRLPGISGLEVLRRLREIAVCGPVIMVAETPQSAQIVEAIQLGADDFVRRPYTAEDLENA